MKTTLLFAALFFASVFHTFGQESKPKRGGSDQWASVENQTEPEKTEPTSSISNTANIELNTSSPYVRPNAEKRFKNYADSVIGPAAIIQYVTASAVLTGRNSPKEWGSKWNGFGYRFGNSFIKSAIKNTAVYGLDEALKVDSTFYRSRDRRVAARFRNSVFSAVTAHDRRGKRVIGLPRIIGGFASEVVSSKVWYPARYDYLHGLKGGAITLAVSAGFNIFKEFVWKK